MGNSNSNEKNYHDQIQIEQTLKLREVLTTLPPFCKNFFRGIDNNMSARTKLGYALDLRIFFEFLHENNSVLKQMPITEYPLSILDQITKEDIEEYMEYLSYYKKDGKEYAVYACYADKDKAENAAETLLKNGRKTVPERHKRICGTGTIWNNED